MKHYLIVFTLLFFLSSCAMPIVYSGYTLPQTNSVEIFYSAGEVHKDYKVMGRMVSHDYGKEIVKKEFEKGRLTGFANRRVDSPPSPLSTL